MFNTILRILGQIALKLKLGATKKDALSNAGSIISVASVITEGLIQANVIPPAYQPLAGSLLATGVAVIGLTTGQTPSLKGADRGE